jgi:hypothetical protein
LIVEELYREFEDKNKPFYLVLLDAKSAFDVVVLSILFRKLYMLGINPAGWTNRWFKNSFPETVYSLLNILKMSSAFPVLIDLIAVDISSIDTVRGGIPSQISLMV